MSCHFVVLWLRAISSRHTCNTTDPRSRRRQDLIRVHQRNLLMPLNLKKELGELWVVRRAYARVHQIILLGVDVFPPIRPFVVGLGVAFCLASPRILPSRSISYHRRQSYCLVGPKNLNFGRELQEEPMSNGNQVPLFHGRKED